MPLLATGPFGAGTTFAVATGATVVSTLSAVLTGNLADQPVDIPYDAESIRRKLPDFLRESTVQHLMDSGAIPRGTPPEAWGSALAEYFGADGDPFNQFDQSALAQAFNHAPEDSW